MRLFLGICLALYMPSFLIGQVWTDCRIFICKRSRDFDVTYNFILYMLLTKLVQQFVQNINVYF